LSSKNFLFALRDRMSEVGRQVGLNPKHIFWERMEGFNTFCALDFNPAHQMELKFKGGINNARYGFLNFSYGMHKTMEFRGLPTFRDAQVALRFTAAYLDFVNSYLAGCQHLVVKRSAQSLTL
jgi:hypothetical protein